MSSGECAHYTHPPRNVVIDRLKQRVEHCKHHSQDCHDRLMATQPQRAENDRLATNLMLQKIQENKAKKTGKYKTDNGRTKQPSDQGIDPRSDEMRRMLKRKLEVNSMGGNSNGSGNGGAAGGGMIQPGGLLNGGRDPSMPPGGNLSGDFLSNQQFDFGGGNPDNAKKMKMDNVASGFLPGNAQQTQQSQQQQQQQQQQQTGSNGCQPNKVSSLSVQIVQQFSNETQQRIETTVNVNTSINSSSMGSTDAQSVSVNVGSKDIKQEMAGSETSHTPQQPQQQQQQQQNTFGNATMASAQGEQTVDDGFSEISDLIDPDLTSGPLDLDSLFDDLSGFAVPNQSTPSQSAGDGKQQQQQQQQAQQDSVHQAKDPIFQCKTEKPDLAGFVSEHGTEQTSAQEMFNGGGGATTANDIFSNANLNGCKTNNISFSHNAQTSFQSQSTIASNNMTSQHIQDLSVSVNSKFDVSQDQSKLQQQQPFPMPNPPNQNGPMPTTPKSAPRLSHPPVSLPKSMSPSSVSYSVSHQPHPGANAGDMNSVSSSFYGNSMPSRPPVNINQMPMSNAEMQQRQQQQQRVNPSQNPMQQAFNPMHHTMGQGMNAGMASQGMPASDVSRAQQLKELAEKTKRPVMNNQWTANTSTSMNMSSNLSFKGHSINQQQHMSADMQNFSSFQSQPVPNNAGMQGPVPSHNNYKEASAAARDALLASRQQQQNSRLPNYPSGGIYSGGMPQGGAGMTAKSMYGGQGVMNMGPMHATNGNQLQRMTPQMGRNIQRPVDMPNAPMSRNLPGNFFSRQGDTSFGQPLPSGALVNGSASMNMHLRQTTAMSNGQQGQVVQQQKYMMGQYHMNIGQKSGQMGMMPHRGPSPHGRPGMQYNQSMGHHNPNMNPSIPSQQLMAGNGAMNNFMTSGGWNSSSGGNVNSNAAAAGVHHQSAAWNRGISQQMSVNSGGKMLGNQNMNMMSGVGAAPVHHGMSGVQQRKLAVNSNNAMLPPQGQMNPGGNIGMSQSMPGNGLGQSILNQMAPSSGGMNNVPQQQQQRRGLFSPPMMQSTTNSNSIADVNFSQALGNGTGGDAVLNSFNDATYSPNSQLNFINEFLEDK